MGDAWQTLGFGNLLDRSFLEEGGFGMQFSKFLPMKEMIGPLMGENQSSVRVSGFLLQSLFEWSILLGLESPKYFVDLCNSFLLCNSLLASRFLFA